MLINHTSEKIPRNKYGKRLKPVVITEMQIKTRGKYDFCPLQWLNLQQWLFLILVTVQGTDIIVDSASAPCKSWKTICQLELRAIKYILILWPNYLTSGNLSQGNNLKEERNFSWWCPLSVTDMWGGSGGPGPESTTLLVGGIRRCFSP